MNKTKRKQQKTKNQANKQMDIRVDALLSSQFWAVYDEQRRSKSSSKEAKKQHCACIMRYAIPVPD